MWSTRFFIAMIKKILLTIVFIIAALWLYDYQSIPKNEFLFNRNLIYELNYRNKRNLSVKIYPDPSDRHIFMDCDMNFVVSLKKIHDNSNTLYQVKEKYKDIILRDYQKIYVELNDHKSKEYWCAKLESSREGHLLNIFIFADVPSFRMVDINNIADKDVKIVREVLEQCSKRFDK